ncbi:hypothetical protein C8Q77DRAFT_1153117 [Trametes polyzona]|nr:hypothetical protein C8Q77DRAFT_1153117 [Trametes polyzona]
MLAGLQQKEMLRSRKRQLAAVLGALAQRDTVALDQVLSASYPFIETGIDCRDRAPTPQLEEELVRQAAEAAKQAATAALDGPAAKRTDCTKGGAAGTGARPRPPGKRRRYLRPRRSHRR